MITGADKRVLDRLELVVARRLDGARHGEVRGWLPGPGVEPGEDRPYVPGDDVRHIDWNVTARTREPHVRDRVHEHAIDVWAVVDVSASLRYGTARTTKDHLSLAAVAAFGLPAIRGGGRLGAVLAATTGRDIVPPRGGVAHLHATLRALRSATPAPADGRTDLVPALGRVGRLASGRSLLVVVSDLLVTAGWRQALGPLAARHDVVVAELTDPRELSLPAVGLLTVLDPETGRHRTIDTTSLRLRERFAGAAADHRQRVAAAIRQAGAHHLALSTDRDWLEDVVSFLTTRRRLAAAGPWRRR